MALLVIKDYWYQEFKKIKTYTGHLGRKSNSNYRKKCMENYIPWLLQTMIWSSALFQMYFWYLQVLRLHYKILDFHNVRIGKYNISTNIVMNSVLDV